MNPGMDKHLNKEFDFNVYSETLAEVARPINLNHLQSVLDLVVRARETKATIFLCGNGGSASNAMHLANDIVSCPAFSPKVVDRVGAGDSVFAMTSILHLVDADPEVIALMGNLSGAVAVSHLGNQKHLTRATVSKSLKSLLK